MDLYETLTHDVYPSAVEHYKEIFWVSAPKYLGPKNYLFSTLFLGQNGSLQNFNIWHVLVGLAVEHYGEIFWVLAHKNFGAHFWRLCNLLATLRVIIFGEEHDNYRQSVYGVGNYVHCPKISCNSNSNSSICSAPPAVSPMVHSVVSGRCMLSWTEMS